MGCMWKGHCSWSAPPIYRQDVRLELEDSFGAEYLYRYYLNRYSQLITRAATPPENSTTPRRSGRVHRRSQRLIEDPTLQGPY